LQQILFLPKIFVFNSNTYFKETQKSLIQKINVFNLLVKMEKNKQFEFKCLLNLVENRTKLSLKYPFLKIFFTNVK
jgi:hypothetical protein